MPEDKILKQASKQFEKVLEQAGNSLKKKTKEELLAMAEEPPSDLYKMLNHAGFLDDECGFEKIARSSAQVHVSYTKLVQNSFTCMYLNNLLPDAEDFSINKKFLTEVNLKDIQKDMKEYSKLQAA